MHKNVSTFCSQYISVVSQQGGVPNGSVWLSCDLEIHMLKSKPSAPFTAIIFGDKAFKQVIYHLKIYE